MSNRRYCRRSGNIQIAAPAPIDRAIDMLRPTSRASELFVEQPGPEQRRLLQLVLEKGRLVASEPIRTIPNTAPFELRKP